MLKQDAATPLYEQLMNEVERKIREGCRRLRQEMDLCCGIIRRI